MARADDHARPAGASDDDAATPYPRHDDDTAEPSHARKKPWGYVFRRTFREFMDDNSTDLAAGLTYHSVLSIFPALIMLVSFPALFGQGQGTTDAILDVVRDLAPASVADQLERPIEELATAPRAGLGALSGLALALWSSSNYVGAFGRAMNRIYGVREGRPFWKLRTINFVITLVVMLLVFAAGVILVVSGPIARSIGSAIGLSDTTVDVWNIVKWPALALVVVIVVALLYWATPNVAQKFRPLSAGALVALVIWAIASAGFGYYVANFGNYDRVYGSLAGIIIFLLWLWLTNLALLFGAEFDAERERARELQAGVDAGESIQLPPRDTKKIEKWRRKHATMVERGRALGDEDR